MSAFPGVLREDGEGLAQAFARTVAASFPVTGASASYVYRFDPASDSFERLGIPLGPVLSERAETMGRGKVSLGLNHALLRYDTINGRDLDGLISHNPEGEEDYVAICVPAACDPVTGACAPGFCEPILGSVRIDLEAQIVALSATYGLTSELDVNLFVPLVRTFLRASTSFTGPDPRTPQRDEFRDFRLGGEASEDAFGVGDLLLRVKYLLARTAVADVAGGLTLSLPTGDRGDFHGTGDTLVGAALYASRAYAERFEPHLNLSFVVNADKFDRSRVRYSAGVDFRIFNWLTLNSDFIGSSDIARSDAIERPVFVQIERSDILQFSTGLKIQPLARTAVFFNALLPLNQDGLRSDLVLAFGIERVF